MEAPLTTKFDTRHLLSTRRGPLTEVISLMTDVPTERVKELLDMGSFYIEGLRVQNDREIEVGTYLRLHLQPKRYAVNTVSWKDLVVFENGHMLVINKPRGIPVHPTVDNLTENVLHQMSQELHQRLLVTQRLDVLTTGLFVIAKTPDFQRAFNMSLVEKRVHKVYSARIENEISPGILKHFMKTSPKSPKLMTSQPPTEEQMQWKECLLRVNDCKPHTKTNSHDFVAEIELLTGRTHQIRAQLGFTGFPLVGDKMYGSSRPECEFHLESKILAFTCPLTSEKFRFTTPDA